MYGSDADRDGLPEMGNLLKNWIITDIDCGVLNRHNGPMLERYGATIKNIDIFQLFRDTELTGSPCLVVMGCLCPPTSHKDYLIHLIKKYNNFNPNPKGILQISNILRARSRLWVLTRGLYSKGLTISRK